MFASHGEETWLTALSRRALRPSLLLLSMVLAIPAAALAGSDYPGLLQPTDPHPTAVAKGDFNADGVMDLAVTSFSAHTVTVFLANTVSGVGDGSFRLASSFVVGEEPWDIAAGDLNNDGALDLVVTEGALNRFSVWIAMTPGGTPDGTFYAGATPGVWDYPVAAIFEDLDGDGNDDIAVANYWSDNVSIFYGDGSGGFASNVVIDAGNRPIDMVTGDFDADGFKDLAIVDFLSDDVAVYLGAADGTLTFHGFIDAGSRPVAGAVGAVEDGIDDIAVANYYDDTIGLLLTSSEATERGELFEPVEAISTEGNPRSVMFGDFNVDGRPDLVYTLEDIDQVGVRQGSYLGTFQAERLYYGGYRPMGVTSAQVDGDGYPDLIVTSYWSHGFMVLNGAGIGGAPSTFFQPARMDAGSGPLRVLLDDLNGDDLLDLITMNTGSGTILVRKGVADFPWFSSAPEQQRTGREPEAMITAGLTTDDLPEVVTVNSATNLLSIFQADPSEESLLKGEVRLSVHEDPTDVVSGDFDRDGVDDLMSYSAATGRLDFFRINRLESIIPASFKAPISIAVGPSDVNGDADLYYLSPGEGAETGAAVAMGDVNGDGFSDVLVGSPGDDTVRLYLGSATPSETPAMVLTGQQAGERFGAAVAFGDLDHDGSDDILVGAPGNDALAEDGGAVYVFLGNQDGSADLVRQGSQAGEAFGAVIASGQDLNGDGLDDWVVGSPAYDGVGSNSGRLYLFWGGGLDAGEDLVLEGEAAEDYFGHAAAMAGDFTGDGVGDLVVGAPGHELSEEEPAVGRVYVYAGGAMTTTPVMVADGEVKSAQLGYSVAGVGDFNGDGAADIGVGAPFYDTESSLDRGQVNLYFGGPSFDNSPDFTVSGRRADARLGTAIAPAGDPTGQGFDDFVVSAPGYVQVNSIDPTATQKGRVYLIRGGSLPTDDAVVIATRNVDQAEFGGALAGDGDVNGDGFDDWVVGASRDGTDGDDAGLALLYKGGQGGIPGPGKMAAADFDGDGGIDLVVVNSESDEVNVLLNDPNEIFVDTDAPVSEVFLVEGHPIAVSAGDVNSDGRPDLAILRESQEDVVIYFGNGDGSFLLGPALTVGPAVSGFSLAARRVYLTDVNGDGPLDLVTVVSAWGGASIRHGHGDGTFDDPFLYVSAELASDVTFGDITGDGQQDMAITDELSSLVAVHFHNGGDATKLLATDVPSTPVAIAPLLAQNFPNPFNPRTEIRYDLPLGGKTTLEVFDVRGRRIKTLVEAQLPPGPQKAVWDGRDADGGEVAAGVYLYRLAVDGEIMGQRKMVLVK